MVLPAGLAPAAPAFARRCSILLSYGSVMMKWRKSEVMLPMPSRGTFGFRNRSGALVRFDFHDEIGGPGRSRTGTIPTHEVGALASLRRSVNVVAGFHRFSRFGRFH